MKVLCLGDNSSEKAWGHHLAEKLAKENKSVFRGMVPADLTLLENGFYHIGPLAMSPKDIIESSKKFDRVILLDQEQDKFSDHRIFLAMFKLVNDMRDMNIKIEIMNKKNMEYLYYWTDFFEKNKSICVYPWILMHDSYGDYTSLCGRSLTPVTKKNNLINWTDNKDYKKIRSKMLKGIKLKNCEVCHQYEDKGIRDQRWNYSFDWIARLKIKDIDQLKKIRKPVYYEIRPSNKCNAMCRMCSSSYSHLIDKENQSIKDKEFLSLINLDKKFEMNSTFDRIDTNSLKRLYIAGGDPSVMSDVYKFMEKCINGNKTDFTFNINTNSLKIKEKFFNLCGKFKKLTISTSVDGVGKINEYIRWKTDHEQQKNNIDRFYRQGNKVHITSVITIYNVASIGETMEMFDKEFSYAPIQLQFGSFKGNILDPYNHPNREMVRKSLDKAKKTKCYWHNESGTTNIINGLYAFYSSPANLHNIDKEKLRKFFVYNDALDKSRGSKLRDYIPELEECRKYI